MIVKLTTGRTLEITVQSVPADTGQAEYLTLLELQEVQQVIQAQCRVLPRPTPLPSIGGRP